MTRLVNGRMVGRRALTLPPNGLEIIRDMAANGHTEQSISYALGMARDALTKLKARDKTGEIEQALYEGRQREHDSLRAALFRKATAGEGKESIIAAIFLLKTRHGYVEPREPFPVGPSVNIEIKVPGSLKPEDYAKLISVQPKPSALLQQEPPADAAE